MKYWKQVAEMLGVDLNQKFRLTSENLSLIYDNDFRLTEDGLQIIRNDEWEYSSKLRYILNGDLVVHSDFRKLREEIEKDICG